MQFVQTILKSLKIKFIQLKAKIIRFLGGRPNKEVYQSYISNSISYGEISNRTILNNLEKEDLIDIICEKTNKIDWFKEYSIRDKEVVRLTRCLRSKFTNDKDMNRALHLSDLENKVRQLKFQLQSLTEINVKYRNENYATGLIVRCTGCDAGKPFDGENLDEEKVKAVEYLAMRLRTWFNNANYRKIHKN